ESCDQGLRNAEEKKDRGKEDTEIEARAYPFDIVNVVIELAANAGHVRIGSLQYLRQTGEPRPNQEATTVIGEGSLELGDNLGPLRARSNQAHIAPQNVDELRHLVDVSCAEKTANRRHSGITDDTPLRTVGLTVK